MTLVWPKNVAAVQ